MEFERMPTELLLRVFSYLSTERDIQDCRYVSQRFHDIVSLHPHFLARPKFTLEARVCSTGLEKLELVLCRQQVMSLANSETSKSLEHNQDSCSSRVVKFELFPTADHVTHGGESLMGSAPTTVDMQAKDYAASMAATPPHLLPGFLLQRVQVTSFTLVGQQGVGENGGEQRPVQQNSPMDLLLSALLDAFKWTNQRRIERLELESICLGECATQKLWGLLFSSRRDIQQLRIKNSSLAANPIALTTPTRLFFRFENEAVNLSRISIHHCEAAEHLANTLLDALTHRLRYGIARERELLSLSSRRVSIRAICRFLDTWINVSEAVAFHLVVEGCGPSFQSAFIEEGRHVELPLPSVNAETQLLRIPSRSHPTAYVEAKLERMRASAIGEDVAGAYAFELMSKGNVVPNGFVKRSRNRKPSLHMLDLWL